MPLSGGGGRITLTHVNVPDANAASINRGWRQYYRRPSGA